MAINLIVIDFDNPVDTSGEALLAYMGYIPALAGTPDMGFASHFLALAVASDYPYTGVIIRLLDSKYTHDKLVVVFKEVCTHDHDHDQVYIKRRSNAVGVLLGNIISTFWNYSQPFSTEHLEGRPYEDGSVVYELALDIAHYEKMVTDARRRFLTDVTSITE